MFALTSAALQDNSIFLKVSGVFATCVSALFLFVIAAANIFVLISLCRVFRMVRNGSRLVEDDLELLLANRGFLWRLCCSGFGSVLGIGRPPNCGTASFSNRDGVESFKACLV